MKIISVVGARPNFMKIAPFIRAIHEYNKNNPNIIEHLLVHTGQHYDTRMSDSFFNELEIPQPDINLEVGSGSHAYQVAQTMIEFEKVLKKHNPDWVVVVGDVNATLACSVTAKKENIKCCHIEAGLRSGDMSMPEEINRLVTDRLSDLLLTPDFISTNNLLAESVPESKIKFVGNIMIDTLESNRKKATSLGINQILKDNLLENYNASEIENRIQFKNNDFALMTMHRPSNVDLIETIEPLFSFITTEITSNMIVLWPIHPRTLNKLIEFGLWERAIKAKNLILLQPLGYLEMLRLNMSAKIMLTDSGGLQEECCVLGTPCLTLRWNTERPITLREHGGASILVGNNINLLRKEFYATIQLGRNPQRPDLWDGQTAKRCIEAIVNYTDNSKHENSTN
jgi:UDP-N-acetylglucosamine 2-epimerase (non-hydrolysing)